MPQIQLLERVTALVGMAAVRCVVPSPSPLSACPRKISATAAAPLGPMTLCVRSSFFSLGHPTSTSAPARGARAVAPDVISREVEFL